MAAHNPRRFVGVKVVTGALRGSAVVGGDGGLLGVVMLAVFVGRRFRLRLDSGIRLAPESIVPCESAPTIRSPRLHAVRPVFHPIHAEAVGNGPWRDSSAP